MTTSLKEFCQLIENCVDKVEEEMRNSIETCRQTLLINAFTDTKVALEKAKDYHYKEIIKLLAGVITNVKQIIYHENKIQQLSKKGKLTDEELKDYSYVRRQVSAFSGGEKVVRRELRRATSENSVYCLETWENFLKEDLNKDFLYLSNSLPNINDVPKRQSPKRKRKQKKLVSSTFENILEDEEGRFRSMETLIEETTNQFKDIRSDLSKSTPEISSNITATIDNIDIEENLLVKSETENEDMKGQISEYDRIADFEDVNQELQKNNKLDTKPRIVGFVVSVTEAIRFTICFVLS